MNQHSWLRTRSVRQIRPLRTPSRDSRLLLLVLVESSIEVHSPEFVVQELEAKNCRKYMPLYSGVHPPGRLRSTLVLQSEKAASPSQRPHIPRRRSYRFGPGPHESQWSSHPCKCDCRGSWFSFSILADHALHGCFLLVFISDSHFLRVGSYAVMIITCCWLLCSAATTWIGRPLHRPSRNFAGNGNACG